MTPNVAPTPAFSATCTAKHVCTLDASASTDSDGTIASYAWSVDKTRIASATPVVTLDLKGNRARQVTLTVTDNSGDSATLTQAVQP